MEPVEYPIKTVADIFNLPSYEHVERCLAEVAKAMLHARDVNDRMAEFWKDKGVIVPNGMALKWNEDFVWVDDGKAEVGVDIADPSGQTILTTRIVKKDTE